MPTGLLDRPTGDLLALLVAATVCVLVVTAGVTVAVVEIAAPEADTSDMVDVLRDVTSALIGLAAGFLAGRRRAGEDDPHVHL